MAISDDNNSSLSGLFQHSFMHEDHEQQDHEQIKWKEKYSDTIGDQSENRRHQAGAGIGGRHLHSDHGLRSFRSEMLWSGMNDRGINWSAAQARKSQAGKSGDFTKREQEQQNACQQKSLSQPYHLCVI